MEPVSPSLHTHSRHVKTKMAKLYLVKRGQAGSKELVAKWSSLSSYTEAINITNLPFAF